jgi:hypothetical protein
MQPASPVRPRRPIAASAPGPAQGGHRGAPAGDRVRRQPPASPSRGGGAGTAADITGSTGITDPSPQPPARWSAEYWQAYFDERAAIAEHDGKLDRPQAEGRAYQACLAEWLDRNPVSSSPEAGCVVCGAMDRPGDGLLPGGIGVKREQVWLHKGCVKTWRGGRMAEAAAALAVMGITSPAMGSK